MKGFLFILAVIGAVIAGIRLRDYQLRARRRKVLALAGECRKHLLLAERRMPQVHSSMHVIRKLKLSENLRFRMMCWGYGSTVGALPKLLNEAEQRIKQAEGCDLRSRKEYLGLLEDLYYLLEISRSYSSFAKRIRNKAKEARQYIED